MIKNMNQTRLSRVKSCVPPLPCVRLTSVITSQLYDLLSLDLHKVILLYLRLCNLQTTMCYETLVTHKLSSSRFLNTFQSCTFVSTLTRCRGTGNKWGCKLLHFLSIPEYVVLLKVNLQCKNKKELILMCGHFYYVSVLLPSAEV